jgi:Zn-dependent protease with chaperone function
MKIEAFLYDGKSSKEYKVEIEFTVDRRVRIDSHNINVSLDDIEIESRLGNIPRVFEFPNGIRCKSEENDKIDKILEKLNIKTSKTHKIESSWKLTIGAIFITIFFVWFSLTIGANYTANVIALMLPNDVLEDIGEATLEELDKKYLTISRLSKENRSIIEAQFNRLIENDNSDIHYKLHFRSSKKIGANAFALPSGDIVLTDQLVALSKDKEFRDILGVLAHEKGHIIKKHTLRIAIQTAISGTIISYLTGDVSVFVTAIPTIIINSSYSRDFEREADEYALLELKRLNVSPKYIIDLFKELDKESKRDNNSTILSIISSHPLTKERMEFFENYGK